MHSTIERSGRPAPDEIIRKPGERVAFAAFTEMPDSDPACLEVGHVIMAQMGLNVHPCAAIRSAWAVWGKHRAGGILLVLHADHTKENGDIFTVSYDLGADEYTVCYAKRMQGSPGSQPEEAVIIEELDGMHCDDLCRVFNEMTGIEIPVVAFG